MSGRRWVPNGLSVVRMLLLGPVVYYLGKNTAGANLHAFAYMLLATATDWLDGWLARRWQVVSRLGRILDPLADKVCVGVLAVCLLLWRDFPWWFALAVVGRDALILGAGMLLLVRGDVVYQSNRVGKATVTILAATLMVYVLDLEPGKLPAVGLSMVCLLWSTFSYAQVLRHALRA